MKITNKDILDMQDRYRAAFVNGLLGPKGVHLLGTRSQDGIDNLSIVSSATHFGANPAIIGVLFRPDSVRRDSLEKMLVTNVFTLNTVTKNIFKQSHQTSARYDREISEFDKVSLTSQSIHDFEAPFVKESFMKVGLSYLEHHEMKVNSTVLVLGRVELVEIPDGVVLEDGAINLNNYPSVVVQGLDSYYERGEFLGKLPYAKP